MRHYVHLMRLDRPIGIWLCFLPASWVLAAEGAEPFYFPLFLLGAAIMRAAGCIINDLTDRTFDQHVARTKSRPLASGVLTAKQAMVTLGILLTLALGIVMLLPLSALLLAFITLPLIIAYPWMKRITWWPQLFLGITFNLGTLFASIAATGSITSAAWLFYAASILWTLGYDTIYALQDQDDDVLIGVKSTALRLGKYVPLFTLACYLGMWLLLVSAGIFAQLGPSYEIGVMLVAAHACWQVHQVKRGVDGGRIFRSNQWLGLILLVAILASSYM